MANNEYGTTWWGRRWLNALSGIDYENRIPRGKDYADAGKVRSLRIDEEKGEVKARVTGHYDPFYGVKITLPPIDKSDVARLVDRLAESPLIVARLAARELSPEIADIAESLGIRIFPTSWKDLEMSCTCPDWAVPCKHEPRKQRLTILSLPSVSLSIIFKWTGGVLLLSPSPPLTNLMKFMKLRENSVG